MPQTMDSQPASVHQDGQRRSSNPQSSAVTIDTDPPSVVVTEFGERLQLFVDSHQLAAKNDRWWYIVLASLAILCAALSPVLDALMPEEGFISRRKAIIVVGAINVLVVSYSTLLGYQARMDKHMAACVEYSTMLDTHNAQYDCYISQGKPLPKELLKEFCTFHDQSVKEITKLSSKTPPVPKKIRDEVSKGIEMAAKEKVKMLSAKLGKVEEENQQLLENQKEEEKRLDVELGKMRENRSELETEKQDLENDKRTLEEDKAKLQQDKDDLERKKQTLEETLEQLEGDKSNLEREMYTLKDEVENDRAYFADLQQRRDSSHRKHSNSRHLNSAARLGVKLGLG